MKFSPTAATVAFLLHAGGTVLLGLLAFGTAMSSFNRPVAAVQQDIRGLEAFSVAWSAGPMVLQRVFHVPATFAIHACWSVIVGVCAGFVLAYLWPKRPSSPTNSLQ